MTETPSILVCMAGAALAGTGVVDAADYGFSPDASAAGNAIALQQASDGGRRTVQVTRPGAYHPGTQAGWDARGHLTRPGRGAGG